MKKIIIAVSLVLVMIFAFAIPVSAASAQNTWSYTNTEVIQFDGGVGHMVCHINVHAVQFEGCTCKFDVHLQGQVLLKCPCGNTEVYKFNLNRICNGQAGEDGVFNGQVNFSCGGEDFHLIIHWANGNGWCKVVPVGPPV